jgi:hypothetical protein
LRCRTLVVTALVAVFSLAVAVAPASASPRVVKGIFDDSEIIGNPDRAFPQLVQLRVRMVRVNMIWGGNSLGVAKRRPARPADPNDPAYDWSTYDRVVTRAAQHRIQVVFAIWGTPGWASPPRSGMRVGPRRPIDLRHFATAAARRYSGNFELEDGTRLPRVNHWLAWNEPNNPAFLVPQYRRVGGRFVPASPRTYAQICNAVVTGVRAARVRTQKIACGVTGPRGNNAPRTKRPSISPLPFLRGMRGAGARGFDAYAHHPYYAHPSETPTSPPRARTAVTLGNINVLIREVTRLYGRKPIWITEYGYQTRPPERTFGVSYALHSRYLRQSYTMARRHPRIDMFIWFLLRDERRAHGWQSGMLRANGARKPAFNVFRNM